MTALLARLVRHLVPPRMPWRFPPGVVRLGPQDWRATCTNRHTVWLRVHNLPPARTDWACPKCGDPCTIDTTVQREGTAL